MINERTTLTNKDCQIITIEGIDGSGKTTTVDAVVDKMKNIGYKAKHFVVSSNYNVYWEIVEELQKKGLIDNSTNQILHNLAFLTYANTILIDLMNNNDFVITEWYTYGKLVLSDLYEKNSRSKPLIQSFKEHHQLIEPDYSFYLDISAEESYKRIMNRNDRKESKESLEMLKKAILLWKPYLEQYKIEKIDALKSTEEISNIILKRVIK